MKTQVSDVVLKVAVQAMDLVADIRTGVQQALPGIAGVCVLGSGHVHASGAAGASSAALDEVGTMFSSAMMLGLALISAVIFIIVAWAVVTKFNDARRGRADWGEVVLPFIIGAGVVIFVGYLVTEGETAAGKIGTAGG